MAIEREFLKKLRDHLVDENYYKKSSTTIPFRKTYTFSGTALANEYVFLYSNDTLLAQTQADENGDWETTGSLFVGANRVVADNALTLESINDYIVDNTINIIICHTSYIMTIFQAYSLSLQDVLDEVNILQDNLYLPSVNENALYSNFGWFFDLPRTLWSVEEYREILRMLFSRKQYAGTIKGLVESAWTMFGITRELLESSESGPLMLREVFDSITNMSTERSAFFDVDIDGVDDFTSLDVVSSPNLDYGTCGDFVDEETILFSILEGVNDSLDWKRALGGNTTYSIALTGGVYTGTSLALAIQGAMEVADPAINYVVEWKDLNDFTTQGPHIFVITADQSLQFLFKTGPNASKSIGRTLGFKTDSDGILSVSNAGWGIKKWRSNSLGYIRSDYFPNGISKGSMIFELQNLKAASHTVTATNKWIDFKVGTDIYSVELSTGTGSISQVVEHVQGQLNGAGSPLTFTCVNTLESSILSTERVKISADGTFDLLFGSGTHEANSAASLLGYSATDHVGLTSYTGDYLVWDMSNIFFDQPYENSDGSLAHPFLIYQKNGKIRFLVIPWTKTSSGDSYTTTAYLVESQNLAFTLTTTNRVTLGVSWLIQDNIITLKIYIDGVLRQTLTSSAYSIQMPGDHDETNWSLPGFFTVGGGSQRVASFGDPGAYEYRKWDSANAHIYEFLLYNDQLTDAQMAILGNRPWLELGYKKKGWILKAVPPAYSKGDANEHYALKGDDGGNYTDPNDLEGIILYDTMFKTGGAILHVENPNKFSGSKDLFKKIIRYFKPAWLYLLINYDGDGFGAW